MDSRRKILTTVLMAALAGPAIADPFYRSPRNVGIVVNDRLRLAGLDLRFELEWCAGRELIECRFSSARAFLVATGRAMPPRTREIMIAADLLAADAAGDVHDRIVDATAALGATMEIFDAELQPNRRSRLLSDLPGAALRDGQSEGDGIKAHYSLAFDQGADGLLTITVVPKR
ncbi:hypothetical protein [Microvirga sp. VF16]|uniref:hypothetical protein n=1 Tax=Microvirga sp. VF16 TaxID=2807101 RepID=UPI00193DB127|nr:hypothetical protein [Microvirga sp. VF16]QRM34657.1 hypothetical protein JO965_40945 [Microvirga sp. VF16]